MSLDTSALLKMALRLPAPARAALAASLISSLDEHVDEQTEAAWGEEIRSRLDDLDSGRVKPIPWEDARTQLHAKLEPE